MSELTEAGANFKRRVDAVSSSAVGADDDQRVENFC